MKSIIEKQIPITIALLISAIMLSAAATYAQVETLGIHFLRVQQEKVHQQMLDGAAGNPWQYRILGDAIVEPLIQLARQAGAPQPESFSFITLRFIQCVFILMAAGIYYRKLRLSPIANLLGLSVLTWSMAASLYNSDLSFNVYFDIAFYLLAGILILDRQFIWLAVLMVPAALNRETSVLIPFLLFFAARYAIDRESKSREATLFAIAALAIFVVIFTGLRFYYGRQLFLTADGYYPGLSLLAFNLRRAVTWEQLAITLGVVPFLAVLSYQIWPQTLKVFFWALVPVWLVIHFVAALVAETRLLLVPQALVFIPGALLGIMGEAQQTRTAGEGDVADQAST